MAIGKNEVEGRVDTYIENYLVRKGRLPDTMYVRIYIEEKIKIRYDDDNRDYFTTMVRRTLKRVRKRFSTRKQLAAKVSKRIYAGMTGAEISEAKLEKFMLRWMMAGHFNLKNKKQIDSFIVMMKEFRQMDFLDTDEIPINGEKLIPGVKYYH